MFQFLGHSGVWVWSVRPEARRACTVGLVKQRASPLLPLLSVALPWGPSCPVLRLSLAPAHNLCSLGREQDTGSRAGRQGSDPSRGSGEWGSVSGTAQGMGQDWWKVFVFLSVAKKHIRDWINASRHCLSVEGEFSSSLCVAVKSGQASYLPKEWKNVSPCTVMTTLNGPSARPLITPPITPWPLRALAGWFWWPLRLLTHLCSETCRVLWMLLEYHGTSFPKAPEKTATQR